MSTHVSVTELERDFSHYLDRVVRHREHFVLTREGKTVAELRPCPTGRRLSELAGIVATLPRLGAAEAGTFARDIDEAREKLDAVAVRDPWNP